VISTYDEIFIKNSDIHPSSIDKLLIEAFTATIFFKESPV
jgi:hypothetical protein